MNPAAGANTAFRRKARQALADPALRQAMSRAGGGFAGARREAAGTLPEFDALCDAARDIKDHVLSHLDLYLETYERQTVENGGQVHWASTAEEACAIISRICQQADARLVVKGKSMVSEEIGLNEVLEKDGIQVAETDLGEYIIQLAGETPSHIIAPAIHKTRDQITELFYQHHRELGYGKRVTRRDAIVDEARGVLRSAFARADVGITGANFLVAETGANVIVTNEGNGDLSSCLPRVQIITAGIEKVIPSLDDLSVLLRVLGRSATGQEMSAYTTLYSGPRREADEEGPEEYHVVLVDNGRSAMLAGEYRSMLRCIRCGACLNHCPVYSAVGGHPYGWVYPGPMGSVLTPLVKGFDTAFDLPNACTLNGRCSAVCPVRIPLSDLLRQHRVEQYRKRLYPLAGRVALSAWSWLARRPRLYQGVMALPVWVMHRLGRRHGGLKWLLATQGWTDSRDMPAPESRTFLSQWQTRREQDQ